MANKTDTKQWGQTGDDIGSIRLAHPIRLGAAVWDVIEAGDDLQGRGSVFLVESMTVGPIGVLINLTPSKSYQFGSILVPWPNIEWASPRVGTAQATAKE